MPSRQEGQTKRPFRLLRHREIRAAVRANLLIEKSRVLPLSRPRAGIFVNPDSRPELAGISQFCSNRADGLIAGFDGE